MAEITASAKPRKWFFVEMFTRDISLSDCILDLVDNSIDGLVRKGKLDLSKDFFDANLNLSTAEKNSLPTVKIQFDNNSFKVVDNCGGIPLNLAKTEVFNFGHEYNHSFKENKNSLGVYGVGLKRALFKLGDSFEITSKTSTDGFVVALPSIVEWMKNDTKLENWSFPLTESTPAKSPLSAGTQIKVKNFSEEVRTALQDGEFNGRLVKEIAKVYGLFLERYVRVTLNDFIIEPIDLQFGKSDELKPANKQITIGDVSIKLMAGIAAKSELTQWGAEWAGWYIACNGRLVVAADKTELTGWGGGALPQYHSKFRRFLGIAFFRSEDPMLLPWRTTKRGLNQESLVFQKVRNDMRLITRDVITFLDKMYQAEPSESLAERQIVEKVQPVDIRTLSNSANSEFDVNPKRHRKEKTTSRIQYDADIDQINAIRKLMKSYKMTNGEIGRLTFDDFVDRKGLK